MNTKHLLVAVIVIAPLSLPAPGFATTLAELLEPGTVLRVLADSRLPIKRGSGRPMPGYLPGGSGGRVLPAPGGVMTGSGTNATDRALLSANGSQLPAASGRPDAATPRGARLRDLFGNR